MQFGIYIQVASPSIPKAVDEKEQQNYEELKNNFRSIFDNTIHKDASTNIINNVDYNTIVTNWYNIKETKSGKYDIDIKVPKINIEDDNINEINENIKSTYIPKLIQIATQSTAHTIYNINYVVFINNNILSLGIKCTLKDGTNPQRVMLQTFNINLETNELLTIEDAINLKSLNKEEMQSKINKEIQEITEQNELIGLEGYSVFTRNLQDSIYKVDNIDNFLIGENDRLYVIYAYGNNNYTSQMDLIIF